MPNLLIYDTIRCKDVRTCNVRWYFAAVCGLLHLANITASILFM